jgi:prepilin-type N-terminal cleavage/methylation domain-containing protein/prepilin-type processing-associated H-X9-DG protein
MELPMKQNTRKAFTLIELLVVITIIGMMTAVLLPALTRAKQQGKTIVCRSNLRQFAIAAMVYTEDNDGFFPLAYLYSAGNPVVVSYAWDFTSSKDWDTGEQTVEAGMLWQGDTTEKIHQCPSYKGQHNWIDDPYTGYNYNTSYIGGYGSGKNIVKSSRRTDIAQPSDCAVFGDGGFASGANKFMRSPFPCQRDEFYARYAGTQAYRHLAKTNVAYADGSVRSTKSIFKQTDPALMEMIAEGTGFLSDDNHAYDLK